MMHRVLSIVVVGALGLSKLCCSKVIIIKPQPTTPNEAKGPIDPAYVGFGIEATSFPDYAGNSTFRNPFSANLLKTFANVSGKPVHVRVGGTSFDHSIYDPSLTNVTSIFPNGRYDGLRSNLTLGRYWVESYAQWSNILWGLNVPLARRNLTNAFHLLQDTFSTGKVQLSAVDSLEIGNEPNLYPDHDRNHSYSITNYIRNFKAYASNLLDSSLSLGSGPLFRACDFDTHSSTPWDIKSALAAGADTIPRLKSFSQHYYQTTGGSPIASSLLNHSFTVSKLNAHFADGIKDAAPYPFILGEVGAALGLGVRDYPLQASLGAAVWAVDFLLYTMSMGVARVEMQMITDSPFSAWQPVTEKSPKAVQAQYYGLVFGAEFAADGVKVAEIRTGGEHDPVAAYGAWKGGRLTKVAVLNLAFWESGNSTRPYKNVKVHVPDGTDRVKVEVLTGPDTLAQHGLTWADRKWTVDSVGKPKKSGNTTKMLEVEDNTVAVSVNATEVVMLTLLE